jgi:hypothetical protein
MTTAVAASSQPVPDCTQQLSSPGTEDARKPDLRIIVERLWDVIAVRPRRIFVRLAARMAVTR